MEGMDGMESAARPSDRDDRRDLVIAGTVKGIPHSELDLVVAIETVVPDNEIPEILAMYSSPTRTDPDGRFVDRYDLPDEVRHRLGGWVMCTVVVQPRVRGTGSYTKMVRWQRQSSSELIAGLSALLATVSFDVGLSQTDGTPAIGGESTSWFGHRLR
jgi:hypothetical protein